MTFPLPRGFDGGAGTVGLGGAPVLPGGELDGDGGEDKEEERRGREVPMPLGRRGDEVDDERGAEPGQKEAAFPLRSPGGPHRVTYEDRHKAQERQKGEHTGLGALLEIHVVDLFDALEAWSVLQPRVLERPRPRAGERTLLPRLPGDPPVGSPGADI